MSCGLQLVYTETVKLKAEWCCREWNLDGVVLQERVIEGRLVGDVHTVYDVTVWALLSWFLTISTCKNAERRMI
jgi:hypothetical protein